MRTFKGTVFSEKIWNSFWVKSDKELSKIQSASLMKSLSSNIGDKERYDLEVQCAASSAIIAEKAKRKTMKDANIRAYQDKIRQAYTNLTAAYTPNGQLIVEILKEEDGLLKNELHAWCDELLAIEEEAFEALIQNLIGDGVICEKNGRYYYLRTCYETLSFYMMEDYREWAYRTDEDFVIHERVKEDMDPVKRSVANMLNENFKERIDFEFNFLVGPFYNEIFYPEDLFVIVKSLIKEAESGTGEIINNRYMKKKIRNEKLDDLYEDATRFLEFLYKKGVLKKEDDYYYMPLLGES